MLNGYDQKFLTETFGDPLKRIAAALEELVKRLPEPPQSLGAVVRAYFSLSERFSQCFRRET